MHKGLWTPAVLLALSMTLAACGTLGRGTRSGTPTISASSSNAAACLSMSRISPNRGKPGGVTTEDIAAALDRDNPVARVRNLVGDTSATLTQVDKNNAALQALCGK